MTNNNKFCRFIYTTITPVLAVALLASCSTVPTGPTINILPASGKPYDLYIQEDQRCRTQAAGTLATPAGVNTADKQAAETVGGTVLGALAGAGLGAIMGPHAARTGAVLGGVTGTAVGANASNRDAYSMQQQYNMVYQQCMYALGNQTVVVPQVIPVYEPYPYYYRPAYYGPVYHGGWPVYPMGGIIFHGGWGWGGHGHHRH